MFLNQTLKKKNIKDNSFLYRLTLIAAVTQLLSTIPQAYQLYTTHDAASLSVYTWIGYLFFGSMFLLYGIRYRLAPIILTQSFGWYCSSVSLSEF
jgi:uncharacterized protein with PQ loop repeat